MLDQTLQISVPSDKYVKLVSPKVKPEVREEPGRKIYSWKTSQLEPTAQTPDKTRKKQATDSNGAAVQLTKFKSWDEVGRWYHGLQTERVAVTPAIQAKADELTRGLKSQDGKERAIYGFVSTQFRYISLSFGVGRYQPHAAEEVLANQYGDCKDKHTLFAALLKAAGIDAWPALIGAGLKMDENVPSPAQFNHVITVIPNGKSYVWLDTTPEVAPYGLLSSSLRDEKALVIPSDGPAVLMDTPADPPLAASQVVKVEAALKSDGTLTGHFDVSMRGDVELLFRIGFHQVPPAKWRDLVQGLVHSEGFAGTVSNVEVSNPNDLEKAFHYSYDYTRSNYSDWANHRISPPLSWILLAPAEDAEKPVEPFFWGARGEIDYRSTVRLPENYSAKMPQDIDAQTDFADYHSSYSLMKGVFSAERRLVIKKAKIPVNAWDEYRKLAKKVADDHDASIQLSASTETTNAGPAENNADVEKLINQAAEAGQRHDINAARDYLARAERLNPEQWNLWAMYGSLYLGDNEIQKGYDAIKKEIKIHPDNAYAYRFLTQVQKHDRKDDEAIETLQSLHKAVPDDIDGVRMLSSLLLAAKRYGEIPGLVQPLLAKGDNQQLQPILAQALLKSGHKEEGLAAVKKYASTADSIALNDTAYFLADTNTELPLAKEYGEKALSKVEEDSSKLNLSSVADADLRRVNELAAAWDTLGWIYFKLGDHLGQVYAKEGKRQEAIHAWQLALAVNSSLEETRERLRLAGAPAKPEQRLVAQGKWRQFVSPGEELGQLRTLGIPALTQREGSGDFFLLFSKGKAEEVQFISGTESLKGAADALKGAHYNIAFPDSGPEKIVRRGILSCSRYTTPSCQLAMLLPETTNRK